MSLLPHAATHSGLEIFQKYPTLINFKSGVVQKYYPLTSAKTPVLDFEFQTARNVYTDLRDIDLDLLVSQDY